MQDEEDYLDYTDGDSELAPDESYGYDTARPGPTTFNADVANYATNPALQSYQSRQNAAIEGLRAARERAMAALRPPTDDKSKYLALAAGFFAPTRAGSTGESISNALQNYLPYKQQERQEGLQYQNALAQYDMDLAQAEYNQAMKPPQIIDMYDNNGRKIKAVLGPDGLPQPLPGSYAPTGAQDPMAKIRAYAEALNDPKLAPVVNQMLAKPGTQVHVDVNEGNQFGKKLGEWDADMYSKVLQAGMDAPVTIANYQRLGTLLSQVKTGKYRGSINEFSKALQTFGIDPGALGIDNNTGVVDAANAISNDLALQLRNPSMGAGMPGALSDSDRNFLRAMVPGIETSPEAIPLMVGWRVKLEERKQEMAKMARQYRKEHNGIVDDGFADVMDEYAKAHPLFTDQDRKDIENITGKKTIETKESGAPQTSIEDLNADPVIKGKGQFVLGKDGHYHWQANPE